VKFLIPIWVEAESEADAWYIRDFTVFDQPVEIPEVEDAEQLKLISAVLEVDAVEVEVEPDRSEP
jgi:hypothetical protein